MHPQPSSYHHNHHHHHHPIITTLLILFLRVWNVKASVWVYEWRIKGQVVDARREDILVERRGEEGGGGEGGGGGGRGGGGEGGWEARYIND